jgi:DNA-binding NtrC family response regulator
MKRRKFPLIFIVEDDVFYASAIKHELEKEKLTNIEVYHSGEEAFGNMYKLPEIVLLDHGLGDANGLSILKKIKSLNPSIQVVFLSGQDALDVAVKSLKYGAFDYIEKDGNGLINMAYAVKKLYRLNYLIVENERYKMVYKYCLPALLLLLLGFFYVAFGTVILR